MRISIFMLLLSTFIQTPLFAQNPTQLLEDARAELENDDNLSIDGVKQFH